jgi:plasmid replication initiation protein
MNKKDSKETVNNLQSDDNYIVLSNPLASPKFIRTIGKGQNKKELSVSETYTPKVFYEIVSRLTPEHLEGIKRTETIKFDINIKQFLTEIGANSKNYRHLIDSVDALISTNLKWKEGNDTITTPIISKSIHNEKTGKIELYVDSDLAKHILEVKDKENFSFLKSNIFRLQNAQAIKLYPHFKRWLGLGRYAIDLERFKNDFGYNTSGYVRFSLLKQKVLDQAIEEINEKTDIIVNYELTGENLDSQRPRVRGLIFVIKSKEKILKAVGQKLADQERNETKPQEPKTQREKTQQNQLSTLYTIFTSLKFEATARLPRETAEATIMQWIDKNGYDAVYNGLMRAKDTYKGEIKNPIGFFSGNYFKEYKDYIRQKEEAKEEQKRAKEEKAHKEQQARKLKIILDDFKKREFDYFVKLYNEQSEEIQQAYIEEVKRNPMYFDLKNRTITKIGAMFVGQKIAETTEYNPRKTLQNLAQRDYLTKIMFDQDGKPFIQEGLFDEQPQEQTEPPQTIEEAAPPTVPPLTTPLPHAQEQSEPTPSDFSAQSSNQDLEETAEPVEDVETPKSIKSLLGKWFK